MASLTGDLATGPAECRQDPPSRVLDDPNGQSGRSVAPTKRDRAFLLENIRVQAASEWPGRDSPLPAKALEFERHRQCSGPDTGRTPDRSVTSRRRFL